jgi:hypothetical protein
MNDTQRNHLVQRMLDPTFYDHPVTTVDLIETHISWIFLAGDFAYKLKKPVDFGFLDFSTLAKRHFFCMEELRINQRFAPQLYLEVISIDGELNSATLHGQPIIDYAVKMQRFPQQNQLDRMLVAGQLTTEHIDSFAKKIAHIHQEAPLAAPGSEFGTAQTILAPILQNFAQIRRCLPDPGIIAQLDKLESWSLETHTRLEPTLKQRKEAGFIRECHGDMHLANMAWVNQAPLLFDAIEFNEKLRWIDPINDVAFLAMDLDDRGETTFGWRFLNRYLHASGDYAGMSLLNFYKVYRALVRAKVTCLRLSQEDLSAPEHQTDRELLHSYLELATGYMTPPAPLLIITHGLSGSGKTSFVNELAPLCHGICVHSDLERKRLYHLAATQRSHSPIAGGIYTTAAGTATYQRLHDLAQILLAAGIPAIVDATCIKQEARHQLHQLAVQYQAHFVILDFPMATDKLRQRIRLRAEQPDQISEATEAVLDKQLANAEPLNAAEKCVTINIDPATEAAQVAQQLNHYGLKIHRLACD